ncbi:hypothetical protein [Bdellovibrio sp. HCB-162]|uniref:hypothetical protein n=1 Tax=Bdellovibrio sp. HCB-162 TaxID=3394234 RepID=UPI0039BD41A3
MQYLVGMKILKIYKPFIAGLLGTMLLAGFTGKEKYVELESYLNGRTSASFTASSNNIAETLQAGTRGEILEYKKLPSGNYGLRIKVLNGNHANSIFWVYHKLSDSDLALYETVPQGWGKSRAVASVEKARGVQTTRDTQARTDSGRTAVELIGQSNKSLKTAGEPACVNCSISPVAGQRSLLRPPTSRGMSKACSNLMNAEGELGSQGQSVFSIMAEPKYAGYFTANNALGSFCPKFNTLSKSQKLHAWTWFWTALAKEESSCNLTQKHGTTYRDKAGNLRVLNPREGYGMWALERDRNVRAWRGAACNNIATAEGQARCSIDIMMQTQLSKGRTAGVNSMSYWGPVRRGNTQLMPHMRRLSLCF